MKNLEKTVTLETVARLAGNLKKRESPDGIYDLDAFIDALGDWIFETYDEALALAFDRRVKDIAQEGP